LLFRIGNDILTIINISSRNNEGNAAIQSGGELPIGGGGGGVVGGYNISHSVTTKCIKDSQKSKGGHAYFFVIPQFTNPQIPGLANF
jgi:hypothetical protein